MRIPPHNLEAEASLLGALLLSREAVTDVLDIVEVDHFYRPAHAHVYQAIRDLFTASDPVDAVTVSEALERNGVLDAIGGIEGLLSLQLETPTTSNATSYARIVREKYILRRLIEVAGEITELGYSRPEDVTKAVDSAENLVYQIAQGNVTREAVRAGDLMHDTLDRLEELYERKGDITGTPTGYGALDRLLWGLQPDSLYVVGARPSMGKTAFALGMAAHAAVRADKPALVFSLEMGHLELTQRLLSSEARVDSTRMRDGRLDATDWDVITETCERFNGTPLWIDDNPSVTLMEIRARARRLKSQTGSLGMVVVDYLQLMTGNTRKGDNRQVEVAEISRGLKILARELRCPVVALSQLSRNLEARKDKRPVLADLRESGAIEQDADVVMFLYRDDYYNPDNTETEGTTEVIVAKNRNGPTQTIRLAFLKRFTAFQDFAPGGAVQPASVAQPATDDF